MNLLRLMTLLFVAQIAAATPQGSASTEGVVVKLGTTDVRMITAP